MSILLATKDDLLLYYKAITVGTYAAATAFATGEQKLLITVTADENSGGSNVKYWYDGTVGILRSVVTSGTVLGYEAVVANYAALPSPAANSGKFYYVSASQGTKWLPGSLGGTYYKAGTYYSNGTTWVTDANPFQATQSDVNAGVVTDQFVSPSTLANTTILDGRYYTETEINALLAGILNKTNNLSDLNSAATARANLGVDKRTTVGNADYTILSTDKEVVTSVTFTAQRTFTLPAANSVNAGYEIIVADEFGAVNGSNTLVILRAGSDTINGATSETIGSAFGMRRLFSDGSSKWTFDKGVLRGSNNLSDLSSAATARTNLGIAPASMSAYKMRANNTNVTSDATEQTFKDIAEQALTSTITFTGGAAPSTVVNNTYSWMQIGKLVTLRISLSYTTNGTTLTVVAIDLPSDLPTPVTPSGFSGTGSVLYYGSGAMALNIYAINTTYHFCGLVWTGSVYQVQISRSSNSARYFWATITYWTT